MEQTSPNRHRTINSFEAYFAKDRFIKCGRGGSNIAFCGARIAAEASHALSDECSHFVARACRSRPGEINEQRLELVGFVRSRCPFSSQLPSLHRAVSRLPWRVHFRTHCTRA